MNVIEDIDLTQKSQKLKEEYIEKVARGPSHLEKNIEICKDYAKHLRYRLFQKKKEFEEVLKWIEKNNFVDMSKDNELEKIIDKVSMDIDKLYNSKVGE